MTKTEESTISLPELEEPFCCSKVQEPDYGLPETTIGYLHEDYRGAENAQES
jgi:hypothetical protein